ncbi:MAG: UDP-N-acetylmuramoyl-L-alanine--D-glutamate ligase [candidate division WOR-3 bacterium]|nr:UDP-N-acetylmuramoyl-L-alanine--D-glutamate ligase [candidate division WOR-3 bacterium]
MSRINLKFKKITRQNSKFDTAHYFAVIGLGRCGKLVTKYLLRRGKFVYVYDDNPEVFQNSEIKELINKPNCQIMTNQTASQIANQIELVICSPGIGPQNQIVRIFERRGVPVIDEIDFTSSIIEKTINRLSHSAKDKVAGKSKIIIAITGTNGKSTATVLLGKILTTAGKDTFYGGNLAPGEPFASALFQQPKDYYVIEVSSFQLERSFYFHPHIAIILNITADHLNRHRTLKKYREIKFRIFANQSVKDYAIINADDKIIMNYKTNIRAQVFYFSRFHRVKGAYLDDGYLYFQKEKICARQDIKLPGDHYLDSVLAVITAAKILKIDNESIVKILKRFSGLEHRLEYVRTIDGVKYINNSMCTNPAAGTAALYAFSEPIILIAGGAEKRLNVKDYVSTIANKTKWTVLFGENRQRLAEMLKAKHFFNYSIANSLEEAIMLAKSKAVSGDLILFSPGFASFDAFNDFQERGNAFKMIVKKLC